MTKKNPNAKPRKDRLWQRHPTGVCEVPACGRKHVSRGFCGMHLMRVRRTGRPGSAEPRAQAASSFAVDMDPKIAAALKQVRRKVGDTFASIPHGRGYVVLSGKAGKSRLSMPKLQAFQRRGWIEEEPTDPKDKARLWVVTARGKTASEQVLKTKKAKQ